MRYPNRCDFSRLPGNAEASATSSVPYSIDIPEAIAATFGTGEDVPICAVLAGHIRRCWSRRRTALDFYFDGQIWRSLRVGHAGQPIGVPNAASHRRLYIDLGCQARQVDCAELPAQRRREDAKLSLAHPQRTWLQAVAAEGRA